MKKALLVILLILVSVPSFSYSTKEECAHDWKLEKIENGNRHWVCIECGERYVAKPKKEIKVSEKTKTTIFTVVIISIICIWLSSILTKYKGTDYDKERHCRNTIYFLIPFIVVFGLSIKPLWDEWLIVAIPFALILSLLASMVGMLIGYTVNISRAKSYDIPNNDPRVQNERNKRTGGIIATITSLFCIGHHVKKNVKELADVDSWKEMK